MNRLDSTQVRFFETDFLTVAFVEIEKLLRSAKVRTELEIEQSDQLRGLLNGFVVVGDAEVVFVWYFDRGKLNRK